MPQLVGSPLSDVKASIRNQVMRSTGVGLTDLWGLLFELWFWVAASLEKNIMGAQRVDSVLYTTTDASSVTLWPACTSSIQWARSVLEWEEWRGGNNGPEWMSFKQNAHTFVPHPFSKLFRPHLVIIFYIHGNWASLHTGCPCLQSKRSKWPSADAGFQLLSNLHSWLKKETAAIATIEVR